MDTALIHGTFNVNLARKELKKYIKDTLGLELGVINAQYSYSAIAEQVALQLIRSSGKFNTKSSKKADLYEVKLEDVQRAIRESSDFSSDIKMRSEAFNPTEKNYVSSFFDTEKVLKKYLEDKAFTDTNNVTIPKDTLNFVCYILSSLLPNLTRTACVFSEFAKKKNIKIKNLRYSCNIHLFGALRELVIRRIDEVETLVSGKKEENKDGDNEENGKKEWRW